jgi:DtxR family Mn-dependent transcriptional regulator
MLTEIFEMEWYKVHDEAEQLEHAVSSDFERRLIDKLGQSEACPHGNQAGVDHPKARRDRGWKPLDEIAAGQSAKVMCVFERDRSLLEYLDGLGIRPSADLQMIARNYDDTLTLKVAGKPVQLGTTAAQKVWVA